MKKQYLIYDIGVGYYAGGLCDSGIFSTDIHDAFLFDTLEQAERILFDKNVYKNVFTGRLLEVKVFYTDN